MIKSSKPIAVVVVFTGYLDGTVDFTMDAPRKDDFPAVEACIREMTRHLHSTIKYRGKRPYNPDNPKLFETSDSQVIR